MADFDAAKLIILCLVIAVAQFVDAIAGGGGTVSAPAYLALGFPPHITLGTSKCSSTIASAVTVLRFGRRGLFEPRLALFGSAAGFIGSTIGARIALGISPRVLQIIMITLLPLIAFYLLTRKQTVPDAERVSMSRLSRPALIKGMVLAFGVGIYEGLLGPGTGTFLLLLFTGVLGLDVLTASGTAKMVNYAGTVAAFISFLAHGQVLLIYAIPTAICGMIGGYLGSGMALKNGERIVRPMMLVVVGLLFAKITYDFFMGA
jgi:uncharacterized membrane protein YfcA